MLSETGSCARGNREEARGHQEAPGVGNVTYILMTEVSHPFG